MAKNPLTVLLAAGPSAASSTLRHTVERSDHRVWQANDGAHAIELANTRHFDIAMVETGLPVLDGETVIRLIRNSGGINTEAIIVGVVTQEDAPDAGERLLSAGANDILHLPVSVTALAHLLSPQEGNAPPVLDPTYLEDMLQWVGSDAVLTLLASASSSFAAETAAIRAAWANADLAGVRENAHRLKGAAGSVGCRRLSDLAHALQKLERADLADGERLNLLEAEVETALSATSRWRPT